jgi:heme-degrading monooxygenase HmoA
MKNTITKTLLWLSLSLTTINASAENVILINPFNVPENKLEESIKFWEKARDFLSNQPGYVSTKLHASIQKDSEYQLINVAEWRSPKEFKAATTSMRVYFKKNKIRPPAGLKPNPGLYSVIKE